MSEELEGIKNLVRHCLAGDLAEWQGDLRRALERAVDVGPEGEAWPAGNAYALNAKLAQARCERGHALQQRDTAYAECKHLRAELQHKHETGIRVASNLLNQITDLAVGIEEQKQNCRHYLHEVEGLKAGLGAVCVAAPNTAPAQDSGE